MKAAFAIIALALASCTTVPPSGASSSAGIGQIAVTNGLKLRPISVVEDSRCPTTVRCVWAGRLVIRVEVIGGSWRQMRDLELGKPQPIADGSLTLVFAEPQKAAPGPTDPRAYRFTFDFQGGL